MDSSALQWATILMLVLLPAAIVIGRHLRGRAVRQDGMALDAANSEGHRRLRMALFWTLMALTAIVVLFAAFLLVPGGLWPRFWPGAIVLWICGAGASIYLLHQSLVAPTPKLPRVVAFFLAVPFLACIIPSLHMGAEAGESAVTLYLLFSLFYIVLVLLSWLAATIVHWILRGFSVGRDA